MIRYTITISKQDQESMSSSVAYGLKAVNEQGEAVLELPRISTRREDVEYLVNHFNQVRIKRDQFF